MVDPKQLTFLVQQLGGMKSQTFSTGILSTRGIVKAIPDPKSPGHYTPGNLGDHISLTFLFLVSKFKTLFSLTIKYLYDHDF